MKRFFVLILGIFMMLNLQPAFADDSITTTIPNASVQLSPDNTQVIYQLPINTYFSYAQRVGDWYKINYQLQSGENLSGYIHKSSVQKPLDKRLKLLVQLAEKQLGKPYEHREGPDAFDCSYLTRWLYKHLKDNNGNVIALSSTPWGQYAYVTYRIARQEVLVAFDSNTLDDLLQPGDILCLKGSKSFEDPGHIALYVGEGNIIHATPLKGVVKEQLKRGTITSDLSRVVRVIDENGEVHVSEYSSMSTEPLKFPDDMEQLYY